jgi:O-antigen ligase
MELEKDYSKMTCADAKKEFYDVYGILCAVACVTFFLFYLPSYGAVSIRIYYIFISFLSLVGVYLYIRGELHVSSTDLIPLSLLCSIIIVFFVQAYLLEDFKLIIRSVIWLLLVISAYVASKIMPLKSLTITILFFFVINITIGIIWVIWGHMAVLSIPREKIVTYVFLNIPLRTDGMETLYSRLCGFTANANLLGAYCIIGLYSYLTDRKKWLKQILSIIPLFGAAFILTGSRGSFLLISGAILFAFKIHLQDKNQNNKHSKFISAISVFLTLTIFLSIFIILNYFRNSLSFPSFGERYAQWQHCLEIFKRNLLFGIGYMDADAFLIKSFSKAYSPHSSYIAVFLENGFIGAAVIVAMHLAAAGFVLYNLLKEVNISDETVLCWSLIISLLLYSVFETAIFQNNFWQWFFFYLIFRSSISINASYKIS